AMANTPSANVSSRAVDTRRKYGCRRTATFRPVPALHSVRWTRTADPVWLAASSCRRRCCSAARSAARIAATRTSRSTRSSASWSRTARRRSLGGGVIRTVWLDNPPVNAVNPDVIAAIRAAVEEPREETRVLVLRGSGERAFSAGADVGAFKESEGGARAIQKTADLLEAAPVPVVAAIHGYCLGGGLELGFPEVRLGLLPGGGGTQRAPRLIGRGRAAWLVMSGERIPAPQAERWGLVEFVVDDLDAGIERVAGTLARQSPNALREIKHVLRETRDERSDATEHAAFVRALGSPDGKEGVAAFLEKRQPRWSS